MNRMTFRAAFVTAIMLAYFCAPSTASADGVTWDLSGVTLSDGSTASGSFVYNSTTNTLSDVDITTSDGTDFTGATYIGANPGFGGGFYLGPTFYQMVFSTDPSDPTVGAPLLILVSSGFPNSLPGTVIAVGGDEVTCGNQYCSDEGTVLRMVTGGDVIAAPEPSALLLLGVGLAGLMVIGKRKIFQT